MTVSAQHKSHTKYSKIWQTMRDCDDGSAAIKQRSGGLSSALKAVQGTAYLPIPNPDDGTNENRLRYLSYLDRAVFVNFTSITKEAMLGMVFRLETQITLDAKIEYLRANVNGTGLTADQLVKSVSADTLLMGRFGLLVDYPVTDAGLTASQTRGIEAKILAYSTESIINWRIGMSGGYRRLTLVVLREEIEAIEDDGFKTIDTVQYRVLKLTDGVYTQSIYDKDGQIMGDGEFILRKSDSSLWDEIPFTFVGAINNEPDVDKPPLYDIAEINIAHYRNSADYEFSSFMVGQPTPVFAGLTQSWVDQNMKGGVGLGSSTAVMLPENGSAELLQAEPNSMPLKGMEFKEMQLVKIGARIIQDSTGVETAEAARIRFAGQNSKLGAIIGNVEDAFIKCFVWAGLFMGSNTDPEVTINKQLYSAAIDPQLLMASIQMMDRAVIAKSDLQGILRRSGMIKEGRTDEEINAEAKSADPMGMS